MPDPPITIQENAALPDEHAAAWPGRPEDAILGALVQIALARYALRLAKQFGIDGKDFGQIYVRLGNANRYAHVAKRKLDVIANTTVTLVTHTCDVTRGYAQAIAGDLKAAAISFVDGLGTLVDGENRGSFGAMTKGADATFGCDCDGPPDLVPFTNGYGGAVRAGAAQESDMPDFKGSRLGRFPLVSADIWTGDHLSERPRSVGACSGTRARGTLALKRRRITLVPPRSARRRSRRSSTPRRRAAASSSARASASARSTPARRSTRRTRRRTRSRPRTRTARAPRPRGPGRDTGDSTSRALRKQASTHRERSER